MDRFKDMNGAETSLLPPQPAAGQVVLWVAICSAMAIGLTWSIAGDGPLSIAMAAIVYVVLALVLFTVQLLTPYHRWILSEWRGHGAASLAALLYWGLGWTLPLAILVSALSGHSDWSWGDRAAAVLAGIVLMMSGYALWIEPNRIRIRRFRLPVLENGSPLHGFRIVHLSDLHFERSCRHIERLAKRVVDTQPDLICITGDMANDAHGANTEGSRAVNQFLRNLHAPCGVFVVCGDWDGLSPVWDEKAREIMFLDTDARLLEDEIVTIGYRGTTLQIMGRSPAHRGAKRDFMAELPAGDLRIILHHFPFGALRAAEVGANLYLAGHTHGGQIRIPWADRLFRPTRDGIDRRGEALPNKFQSGLHRIGQTYVNISRGIGMRGGDAPRIRFCCPPEFTVLELESSSYHPTRLSKIGLSGFSPSSLKTGSG